MRKYTSFALRDKANEILSKYQDIGIDNILDALTNDSSYSKIEFQQTKESDHIKGAVINDESGKNIFINSELADSEKQFVLAHEVAHILLHADADHMDFFAAPKVKNQGRSNIETEANCLAYELIFPLEIFIQSYKENLGHVASISEYFESSIYRTTERLNFLKKQISLSEIENFLIVD